VISGRERVEIEWRPKDGKPKAKRKTDNEPKKPRTKKKVAEGELLEEPIDLYVSDEDDVHYFPPPRISPEEADLREQSSQLVCNVKQVHSRPCTGDGSLDQHQGLHRLLVEFRSKVSILFYLSMPVLTGAVVQVQQYLGRRGS
jgi:hypothetical protein